MFRRKRRRRKIVWSNYKVIKRLVRMRDGCHTLYLVIDLRQGRLVNKVLA